MTRGRYEGMWNIVTYNRGVYAGGLAAVGLALVAAHWQPAALWLAMPALVWMCASLAASHYIYDRSSLYELAWLSSRLSRPPRRWLNIHAGLDENSARLGEIFSGSEGTVLDIYDRAEMTEPSIHRARRAAATSRGVANWRKLPVADGQFDAAFLILAAHELRRPEARIQLFREVGRALCSVGEIVLVEHLRDSVNFAAFGPGFLHFFSGRTWRRCALAAGLRVRSEMSLNPFVHLFVLERSHDSECG
jgi:hypothetical protein